MTGLWSERVQMAMLGWLATVLTSLSFFPALEDKSYLIKGAALSAVVIGFGALLRSLRAPALVVFLLQLVAMAELLVLRFGDDLRWGLLPTRETVRGINALIRDGFDVAQQYAAPAPPNSGLMLMVLFAICLVAIVVDAIAVGLGRVPLAGLPLLALYTIPVAALPEGVPFYAFVPGAATYIAMLMADERDRLAHWGRLVSRNSAKQESSQIDTSGLHATGRQVSFLALTIAVVLPVFIPALSASILDSGRGGGTGGGGPGGVLSFQDPEVSLANQLKRKAEVELMRVDQSDLPPDYLRLVALNNPGPNSWTATPVDLNDTLGLTDPAPPTGQSTLVDTSPHEMRISLTTDFPDDSAWLPVAFGLTGVTSDAAFSYVPDDQTVTAENKDAIQDVSTYTLSYDKPTPTPEQLAAAGPPPADIMARYGVLPSGVPAIVGETAETVTASATNAYQQAMLLQNYFRTAGEFTYSLDVGYGSGYEAMAGFLTDKVGFCQQYSATMAMMARSLGIPSRVVIGFLGGERDGDQYVITSDFVHAWPELYFNGIGWVRFEPTPGRGLGYPDYAPQTTASTTSVTSTGPTSATTRPDDPRLSDGATTDQSGAAGRGSDSNSGPPFIPSRNWLILLVVTALVFLPAGLRYAVRRARLTRPLDPAEAAEAAWAELRDHLRDLRLSWSGSMTPRARERDVARHVVNEPAGLEALHRLAMSVERARYSSSPVEGSAPGEDARIVMSAISRESDWVQRLRAFFWPSSLMPDIRRGWARVTERLQRRPRLS